MEPRNEVDLSELDVRAWRGATVVDRSGERIGKLQDVYLDDATQRPEWIAVSTGWFGTKVSFVPLLGSLVDGETITVAYTVQQVKDSPRPTEDGHLDPDEERVLYEHYGLSLGPVAEQRQERNVDAIETMRRTAAGRTAQRDPDGRGIDLRDDERLVEGDPGWPVPGLPGGDAGRSPASDADAPAPPG
jgi:sporulation protein YlmC with PRC-barrel domain